MLNCGYGRGYSVREVSDLVERVAGLRLDIRGAPRRAGDSVSLVADADEIRKCFAWRPRCDDLDVIVRTAIGWQRKLAELSASRHTLWPTRYFRVPVHPCSAYYLLLIAIVSNNPGRELGMIFRLLIAVVVLAPLPFASVYPWSWSLMAVVVGSLLVAWSVLVALGRLRPAFGLRRTWPFVLLFLIPVIWAALQSLPVTPLAWHHPLWQSAADALGMELAGSVSLDPENTISALVRLLAYGGIFWLSLQYSKEPARARQVFLALSVAGLVYGAYGLVVQFSGSETILWYDKFAYVTDLTSTFVNRNSFATYVGLTLLCTTGLLLNIISKSLATGSRREQFIQLINSMTPWSYILLVAWITGMTALMLTHSRGGFLSTGLGIIALVSALALTRAVKTRFAVTLGAITVIAGVVFFAVGGDVLDKRLAAMSLDRADRPAVYELTLDAIETAPMLGTGYGSFAEVFRFYRRDNISNFYQKAHNTYLENVLELGIPAALALFAAFAVMAALTFRGLRRRQRAVIYPCTGFAATILVAAHSTVDFSLQIPAVAATYALLMGTACAQSWKTKRSQDSW